MKIRKTTKAMKVALRLRGIYSAWNRAEPTIHLSHEVLKEMLDQVEVFGNTVRCPVCEEGLMPAWRDNLSGNYIAIDTCPRCFQHFTYDNAHVLEI